MILYMSPVDVMIDWVFFCVHTWQPLSWLLLLYMIT